MDREKRVELETLKINENIDRWLQGFILAYNICPFAKMPYEQKQIRLSSCLTEDLTQRIDHLAEELLVLEKSGPKLISNTLCIFPNGEESFYDFLDFKAACEERLTAMGLEESYQLVAFHPQFLFAATPPSNRVNWVNRSPYPLLHILREQEISAVVRGVRDGESISMVNEKRLSSLSVNEWSEIVKLSQTPT